jgi:phage shock protein PspC (stress-responsive transcriptional regulator)
MIGAMTSQDTRRSDATGRLLRRHTSDRVIGGVAGGIGDYFNVDPLLIRIGFVGLIIFGGAGLVLYLVAWLLIPAEGQDRSPVEALIGRIGLTPGRLGWIAVVIVAIILLSQPIVGPLDGSGNLYIGPLPGIDPVAFWAVAVIVVGYLLIRRREISGATAGVASASSAAAAPAAIAVPRAPAPPRPRSPLAWYACASVLLTVGLLALASQVADIAVAPGQFFGAALAILGIGLVVGTWWGRARILILLALLLVPLAVAASFMTAPLEGGIGAVRFTPANRAELRGEYRIMGGTLVLDLTDLSIPAQPVHIAASVAAGQLVVIVPPDASVQLRARVGAGQVTVFDYYHDDTILTNAGTSLDEHYVRRHRFGPTYVLDLQGGIGDVFVTNSRVNW